MMSSLTHWGRVKYICVGNLTIIASDNGLSPGRRQAITWTNVGILLIGPLGTNFSEMLIEIHTFSFKKINLKMLSGKWRPFCLGLNVLKKAGEVSHNIKQLNSLKPSDAKKHQWSRSSLFRHQAITWSNADLLRNGSPKSKLQLTFYQN